MSPVKTIIEELRLSPHPEGGWYRETWRAPAGPEERAQATAIHFLLEAHQRSHWHRVDAAEIWLWHAGDPLLLSLSVADEGPVRDVRLGRPVSMRSGDASLQQVDVPLSLVDDSAMEQELVTSRLAQAIADLTGQEFTDLNARLQAVGGQVDSAAGQTDVPAPGSTAHSSPIMAAPQ